MLESLQKVVEPSIVGFFGDSMQSIYDEGIGDIENYIKTGRVTKIEKKQNRRNPQKVIELANKLRTDGLMQQASDDANAPNMETVIDDDGTKRAMTFEDSDMYAYFADHAFLCIMFQESSRDSETEYRPNSLSSNVFIGFKRIVFSDEFIDTKVRKLWEDTRDKIMHHKLTDVVQKRSDGSTVTLKSGKVSTAPNFLKGSENDVFVRGSGKDSSIQSKTECVNGIRMLPQYVWIKGLSVVEELKKTPEI